MTTLDRPHVIPFPALHELIQSKRKAMEDEPKPKPAVYRAFITIDGFRYFYAGRHLWSEYAHAAKPLTTQQAEELTKSGRVECEPYSRRQAA